MGPFSKVVIAPNSFKESLDSVSISKIIYKVFEEELPLLEKHCLPLSDGGDGFLNVAMNLFPSLKINELEATDGMGAKKKFLWGWIEEKKEAWVESADLCGMKRTCLEDRNPMELSSFPVGRVLEELKSRGTQKVVLGLGGSATCDGGMGMLEAMGVRFFDKKGHLLQGKGKNLVLIDHIDTQDLSWNIPLHVYCDVENPLLGPLGAAYCFAPQKGAKEEDLPVLEKGLSVLASKVKSFRGDSYSEGFLGAAGGLAFALKYFLGGELYPGGLSMIKVANLSKYLDESTLVVTGEGCFDQQSVMGKVTGELMSLCHQLGAYLCFIAGQIKYHDFSQKNLSLISLVNERWSKEKCMEKTELAIQEVCRNFIHSNF